MLSRERSPILRRGFLTGLATLPLVGGSVALIGAPTAAATPVTDMLLDSYDRWLDLERSWLRFHRYGAGASEGPFMVPVECVFRERETGRMWDIRSEQGFGSDFDHRSPSPATRAAVILSAAGVSLTSERSRG